jgi:hypothetical protein
MTVAAAEDGRAVVNDHAGALVRAPRSWLLELAVVPALAKPAVDHHRGALLGETRSTLAVHVPDADGWCVGCADLGRYAVAPCPAARQALSLVETHGVAVWDARPAASVGGECGGASLTPLDACGASPLSRAAV